MSWAEVRKINNNFKKTLNEQARELAYAGAYIFESATTFIPEKTGWYKVIVVGAGGTGSTTSSGSSSRAASGGAGGVAIKTMRLSASQSYEIAFGTETSFNDDIIAGNGGRGNNSSSNGAGGTGGTASGGDFNYTGTKGSYASYSSSGATARGANVGVYIPELMRKDTGFATNSDGNVKDLETGYGILGYGASGTAMHSYGTMSSQSGAVIIIPLELEE